MATFQFGACGSILSQGFSFLFVSLNQPARQAGIPSFRRRACTAPAERPMRRAISASDAVPSKSASSACPFATDHTCPSFSGTLPPTQTDGLIVRLSARAQNRTDNVPFNDLCGSRTHRAFQNPRSTQGTLSIRFRSGFQNTCSVLQHANSRSA